MREKLTDEELELVNQLIALPSDRFLACMQHLDDHDFIVRMHDKPRPRYKEEEKEYFIEQGRIKAEYYARMRLATATLELEYAKRELMRVYEHWEEMEKDSPIYWDNVKTKNGWRKLLVGDAARDYNEPCHPNTGHCKLYLPHGEEI